MLVIKKIINVSGTTLRFLPLFCVPLFFISCLDSPIQNFEGGDGTEANPYQISTIEQLQAIDDPEYLDKHFIQTGDIDASASADFQNGSGFKFIGNQESPFTGSYNGNGYVIRNLHLHIQRSGMDAGLILHTGLFGYVKNGRIEHVTIDNSAIMPKSDNSLHLNYSADVNLLNQVYIKTNNTDEIRGIGGLVGFNEKGVIKNSGYIGRIEGHISHDVGGIAGVNTGLIENTFFNGTVFGGAAAGLVAFNFGEIRKSSASGFVEGMSSYGLTVINYGTISSSFVDSEIDGTFRAIGMVGVNDGGKIIESYVKGKLLSRNISAGLAVTNYGEIISSYSLADIEVRITDDSGAKEAGGLVVENADDGIILQSYIAGNIEMTGNEGNRSGVTVSNFGTVTAAYWDTETTGVTNGVGTGNPEGTTGLTTQQITGSAAEVNMPEFDWQTVWRTTDGYPVLRWQDE